MTEQMWSEKYRPETLDDIQGNTSVLNKIKQWATNWSHGDNPILLYGPQGTGKTSTAYAIGHLLDAPVHGINTSSARRKDDIKRLAKDMDSSPIDSQYQVVLLDEVDSWHAQAKTGPLVKRLKNPRNPVIMTANDLYSVPQELKDSRYITKYEFKLSKPSRRARIREVAEAEGVNLSDAELQRLADRPDLRSAINDLQMMSQGADVWGDQREWDIDIWDAVEAFLQGDNSLMASFNVDEDPASMIHWIDENLRKDYRGLEAGVAYDALSRADIKLQRAYKGGSNYRDWKFATALMNQAAEVRLTEPSKPHWIGQDFPNWYRRKRAENHYAAEHSLFEALKDEDYGSYRLAGDFTYFRRVLLPILRQQPDEELFEMVLTYRLDKKPAEALGIDYDEYHEWAETEAPETGTWQPPEGDALEW